MRFNTEDLLTLRDGEPIDADRRARALADPDSVGEIARLEHVRRALRALPELAPPEGVWQRITAELDTPSSSRERAAPRDRRVATRAAAAAVAAVGLVALAASIVGQRTHGPTTATPNASTMPSTTVSTSTMPSTSAAPIAGIETGRWAPASRMAAESARLERLLARQVRFQPEVMNAGTAGTIAGLEDTLAALDEQLTFAAAGGLAPPERETLWQERVNVMRALLQVRYAQAQRTGF